MQLELLLLKKVYFGSYTAVKMQITHSSISILYHANGTHYIASYIKNSCVFCFKDFEF